MSETSEKKRKQLKVKNQCSPCGCVPRAKKRKHLKGGAVQEEDNERDEYIKTSMVKKKEKITTEGPVLIKDLPEILVPGTCISIEGFVKENAKRFAINLMCGKEPHNDIALHLNPRLSVRCIVRNHRIKNGWGGEETTAATKFDIERGQPFSFDILLTPREYFVASNGKHFCAFVYRIPLNHVKFIQVDGDVEITKCEFSKEREYPIPSRIPTKPLSVLTGEGLAELPEREMATPLTAELEQGFEPHWQLEIYGRVKILPHSFYINLQDGDQIWPHPTIHLHLNSRFSHTDALICNAWRNGEWGQEERTSSSLFTPSKPFSLAIRKLDHHFAIWVDGKLVSEFKFRGPATHISTVVFNGDIAVQAVYMNKKSDDKYFNKWREKTITETL